MKKIETFPVVRQEGLAAKRFGTVGTTGELHLHDPQFDTHLNPDGSVHTEYFAHGYFFRIVRPILQRWL